MAEESNREHFVIRVHGDSLSMPRADDDVPFFATYPELLREYYESQLPGVRVHLYNRGRGGQPINVLFSEYGMDAVYFGKPGGDVLVLQVGIVDAAPRPIPNWFKALLSRLPYRMRLPVVKFLHRNRARMMNAGMRFRVTKPAKFRRVLSTWLEKAARDFSRVYVLNIAPTTRATEEHSPGLSAAIQEYNGYLAQCVDELAATNVYLVDVHVSIVAEDDGIDRYINPADGHHITAAGHRMYADAITRIEDGRKADR